MEDQSGAPMRPIASLPFLMKTSGSNESNDKNDNEDPIQEDSAECREHCEPKNRSIAENEHKNGERSLEPPEADDLSDLDDDSMQLDFSTGVALSDLLGTPAIESSRVDQSLLQSKHSTSRGIPRSLEALRVSQHTSQDLDVSFSDATALSRVDCDPNYNSDCSEGEDEESNVLPQSKTRQQADMSFDCSTITLDDPVYRNKELGAKAMRSDDGCPADIKEVTIKGSVGKTSNATVSFQNRKKKSLEFHAAVILVRVDEISGSSEDCRDTSKMIKAKTDAESSSPFQNEIEEAFSLQPSSGKVHFHEEIKLKVRFKPSRLAVYSGAIKIRCGRKSHVVLLRGETWSHCKGNGCEIETPMLTSSSRDQCITTSSSQVSSQDSSSVSVQHMWLRHWLDKELRRESRSEIQYKSNSSTGEKQLIHTRKWLVSPAAKRPHHLERDVAVSPSTIFVNKSSGQALQREEGVFTIHNRSSRPKTVLIDVSSTLLLKLDDGAECSRQLHMAPNSATRLSAAVRPDYISSISMRPENETGEIHWGYFVVTDKVASQDIVCDVRSSAAHPESWRARGVDSSPTFHQWPGTPATSTLGKVEERAKPKDSGSAVYFAKESMDFGSVATGSLKRLKATLCNSSSKEMVLFLDDPKLPFIISHNEIRMKPRSYIRLPVRMVPINSDQEYSCMLKARSACGKYHATIQLYGNTLI